MSAALPVIRGAAYKAQLHDIKRTLAEFGVDFDVYFSEQELHDAGAIEDAVARLREQGHVFDDGGAVWLRTTDFGDDKDRVMIRANGEPTYFAADAAYYLSKKDRGFTEKIYLLGADHHGYINRLKAIAAAAGDDPEVNIEVLIGQLVSVNGAKLSKRAGNIIELKDLIYWLGKDAVRYSLARFPADSPLTLDPELLKKHSNENPVFYVQYAHARSRGTARNAVAAGVERRVDGKDSFDASLLDHATENELLSYLGSYPSIVAKAAELREPHRVARHLEVIAGAYHRWYDACRVAPLGEEADHRPQPHPAVAQRRHEPGAGQRTGTAGRFGAGTDVTAMTDRTRQSRTPQASPLAPEWLQVPADLNALHEPLWAGGVARNDAGELAIDGMPVSELQRAVRHAAVRDERERLPGPGPGLQGRLQRCLRGHLRGSGRLLRREVVPVHRRGPVGGGRRAAPGHGLRRGARRRRPRRHFRRRRRPARQQQVRRRDPPRPGHEAGPDRGGQPRRTGARRQDRRRPAAKPPR